MTPSNLAIVIAPNLLWPADETTFDMNVTAAVNVVVEALVKHADWFFKDDVPFFMTFTKEDLLPDQCEYGFTPNFVQGFNQTAALNNEPNGEYNSLTKSMYDYSGKTVTDGPGRHSRSNSHDTSLILLDNNIKKAQSNSSLSDQSSPPHGSPKPITRRKNKPLAPVPPNFTPDKGKKTEPQLVDNAKEQTVNKSDIDKPSKPPRPVVSDTGKVITGVQTINRSTYRQNKALRDEISKNSSRENLTDLRRQSLEFDKEKKNGENKESPILRSGSGGKKPVETTPANKVVKPNFVPPPRPIAAPRTILSGAVPDAPPDGGGDVVLRHKPAIPERPATLRPQSFRAPKPDLDGEPTVERTHIYTVDKQHPQVIQVGAVNEDGSPKVTVQRTHSSGGKDEPEEMRLSSQSRQLSQSEGSITESPTEGGRYPRPQRPCVPAPPPPATESTDL